MVSRTVWLLSLLLIMRATILHGVQMMRSMPSLSLDSALLMIFEEERLFGEPVEDNRPGIDVTVFDLPARRLPDWDL